MKIHYIVAFWPCPRANPTMEPTTFLKYQLRFARKTKLFHKITFVFNHCTPEIKYKIREMVKNQPVEAIFRENLNCSYGAWEVAVIKNLNEGFDYHFLSEDDYYAANDDFLQPYIDRMTPQCCYVCAKFSPHNNTFQSRLSWIKDGHAGVSNGLLCNEKAKTVYEKERRIFRLTNSPYCWKNQVTFLDYLRRDSKLIGIDYKVWFEEHTGDRGTRLIPIGKNQTSSHIPINFLIKHHKLI